MNTDFGCVCVSDQYSLLTVLPEWADTRLVHEMTRLLRNQLSDGPQIHPTPESRKEWNVLGS